MHSELLRRRGHSAILRSLELDEYSYPPEYYEDQGMVPGADPSQDDVPENLESSSSSDNMTYAEVASGSTSRALDKGKARAVDAPLQSPPSSASHSSSSSRPDFIDSPQISPTPSSDSFDTATDGFMWDARRPAIFLERRRKSWSAPISHPQEGHEEDYEWTIPSRALDSIPDGACLEDSTTAAEEMGITVDDLKQLRLEDSMAACQLEEDWLTDAEIDDALSWHPSPSSDDGSSEGSGSNECGSVADEAQDLQRQPRRRKVRLSQDKRRRRARKREAMERQRLEEEAAALRETSYDGAPPGQQHQSSASTHLATFAHVAAHNNNHFPGPSYPQPALRLYPAPQPPNSQRFQAAGSHHLYIQPVGGFHGGHNHAWAPRPPAAFDLPRLAPPSHSHQGCHNARSYLQVLGHPQPPSLPQVTAGQAHNRANDRSSGHQSLPSLPPPASHPRPQASTPALNVNDGSKRNNSNTNNEGHSKGQGGEGTSEQRQHHGPAAANSAHDCGNGPSDSSGTLWTSTSTSTSLWVTRNVMATTSQVARSARNVEHSQTSRTDQGSSHEHPQAQASTPQPFAVGHRQGQGSTHPLPLVPTPRRQQQHQHTQPRQQYHLQPASCFSPTPIHPQQPSTSARTMTNAHTQAGERMNGSSAGQRARSPRRRNESPTTANATTPPYIPYLPATLVQPSSYPASHGSGSAQVAAIGPPPAPVQPLVPDASPAPIHRRTSSPDSLLAPSASPPPVASLDASTWPTDPRQVSARINPSAPGTSDGTWGCSLFDFCTFFKQKQLDP